jgi:hypothetical protein
MNNFYKWLAWKLPKSLVKWVFLRVVANASTGKYSSQDVPELKAMDALQRW